MIEQIKSRIAKLLRDDTPKSVDSDSPTAMNRRIFLGFVGAAVAYASMPNVEAVAKVLEQPIPVDLGVRDGILEVFDGINWVELGNIQNLSIAPPEPTILQLHGARIPFPSYSWQPITFDLRSRVEQVRRAHEWMTSITGSAWGNPRNANRQMRFGYAGLTCTLEDTYLTYSDCLFEKPYLQHEDDKYVASMKLEFGYSATAIDAIEEMA